ncbi:TPA: hypothetical protein NY311_004221 [Escherichia coli]|uniref:hypothetical protein n=1 Tax=Escherichia coli TaxID=562 RepID=UPI000BE7E9E2|nr:hypothetical protein [Escherichia coli]EFH3756208.1 hypothetical protein [Escherichia coli]EFH5859116.1 hypothetical protein [Escherichia coli]EFH9271171.1 hypothetical protein [Escherichia coli]EHO8302372.1 hypothetical protein [Escherichia coli]EHU7964562.1 hypothetical protein [Escherichia coli]
MNNETEKVMWSCKTSDTPWTFSSLLKKAACAVFSALPEPDTVQNSTSDQIQNRLIKVIGSYSCPKLETRIDGDYIVTGDTEYKL